MKDSLSFCSSVSLAGSSVRGPASRAESNGPVLFLNRLVSVLSACSAGPLTLTRNAQLLRVFQRLRANFRSGTEESL